jgi:hypothetical protein
LDSRARLLEKQEKQLFDIIFAYLKKKSAVEKGMLSCAIVPGGRYPSWKNEFINRLGEDEANKIIANTPCKETILVDEAQAVKDKLAYG